MDSPDHGDDGQVRLERHELEEAVGDVGAEVELRLLLFPERSCVRLSARVIRCNSRADGDAFYIALDFNEPDERERDRLAAHVMRRHSRILLGRNAAPR